MNAPSLGSVQGVTNLIKAHKTASVVIALVIVGIGWWMHSRAVSSATAQTRYVLGTVQKTTVVASVSASGQISASDQLDIKTKAGGDVVYVGVQPGAYVAAGTLIAQIDTTDAQRAVRDAQIALDSAQLSLEKLQGPAGSAVPLNKEQAQQDLATAYDSGFNTVANAFLDLPTVMAGLQDTLYGTTIVQGQDNISALSDIVKRHNADDNTVTTFANDAAAKYTTARTAYDATFTDYKATDRYSDPATIEHIVGETYAATKAIADAVKSASNLYQYYKDQLALYSVRPSSVAASYITDLGTYTGTTNSALTNLLNVENTIRADKGAVTNADIDVQSQKISLAQKQNALADATNALADYYVRAPFAGTIAAVNVKKYDTAGSGTVAATIITSQKIAELSLNEVDAAKIKVGDKATLTFDAIDGLSLTGEVAEIDTLGTVSQGVVSYTVKIRFDTQDTRIKPGMTVNAAIMTDVHQDVLAVPASAVKTQGGTSFVQAFNPPLADTGGAQGVTSQTPPTQVPVQLGISDDTMTEITSGLSEGEQVVVRTISGAVQTTQSAPSLFQAGGIRTGGAGGGGTIRTTGGSATGR